MTCPTCKREDMPDECGPHQDGEECACCGMVIIATADSAQAVPDRQEE